MSGEPPIRLQIRCRGTVQGVGFRPAIHRIASALGLAGWVRNLPDGRVEAVFEGDSTACQKVLDFVQVGPPSARVSQVDSDWDEDEERLVDFTLRF